MTILKKFYITIISILLIGRCYAQPIQVNTMQQIMNYFENADEDTLAIFDIDMVLIQPSDPAFQMANMKIHSPIAKKVMQSVPQEKREIFLTLMTTSSDPLLIEVNTPSYLQQLSNRKVPSMALTANLTGYFASICNLEAWKIGCLRQVGIDFSDSAPYKEDIILTHLPSYRKNYSLFTKGVLFSNGPGCSKGQVLVQFLQLANLHPKKIIFIDDREDNLKDVEAALNQHDSNIAFIGLHYLGARDYPSTCISEQEFQDKWEALALLAKEIE